MAIISSFGLFEGTCMPYGYRNGSHHPLGLFESTSMHVVSAMHPRPSTVLWDDVSRGFNSMHVYLNDFSSLAHPKNTTRI